MEVQEKSVLVCALESTGSNIQEEMEVKGVEPGDMPAQVAAVRSRWEELRKTIEMHMAEIGASADRFDRFLSSMTSFVNWLSEFHSKLYDEVCVQIPPKAKEELVSRHKNRLEVFRAEVSTYAPKLEGLKVSCEEWAEHLVPEVAMDDLPSPSEPSPAPDGKCASPTLLSTFIPSNSSSCPTPSILSLLTYIKASFSYLPNCPCLVFYVDRCIFNSFSLN